MFKTPKDRLFILTPIVLIAISFLLEFYNQKAETSEKHNVHLTELAPDYVRLLGQTVESNSEFSFSISEKKGIRELVIFQSSSKSHVVRTKFSIEVYPEQDELAKNAKAFVNYDIVNMSSIYSHEGEIYAVFRKELPFFNIEKLVVGEYAHYNTPKQKKKWDVQIDKPFKAIDKATIPNLKEEASLMKQIPSPYRSLLASMLDKHQIRYIPSSLSATKDSLFQVQDQLKSYGEKESLIIGKVSWPNSFWTAINKKDSSFMKQIYFGKEHEKTTNQFLRNYADGKSTLAETFDLEKLAHYFGIHFLFARDCPDQIYFVFDKEKRMLEPLFVKSKCQGELARALKKSPINDPNFLELYAQTLNKISKFDLYKQLLSENEQFEQELAVLNTYYPNTLFSMDLLTANQKVIQKSLTPSTALKAELISINKQNTQIAVSNFSNYPIYIKGLNHLKKKNIVSLNEQNLVLSNTTDTINISLPRSFENLFVSKKNKQTGFILHKHSNELFLEYEILGTETKNFSSIIPYGAKQEHAENIMRNTSSLDSNESIMIDEAKKQIRFNQQKIQINSPLIIPANYTFSIDPGTAIDIIEGGLIISYSPLLFKGTETNPIRFFSSDLKGQGLLVMSDRSASELNYVEFVNLANPNNGPWDVSGAVSFYESPVTLKNVRISGNRCEDALNIIRSEFQMIACTIEDTQSDAFDGDFVTGTIKNCFFKRLGNDAIDVSGSSLQMENINIEEAGDKGLSAGENSKMTAKNISISKSEIAVAGKDLSVIDIKEIQISNTKLAFTAFQKKSEFGASDILVEGLKMDSVDIQHLIEERSSLSIDGKTVEVSKNVKERMYGVEFGVSSDETRKVN